MHRTDLANTTNTLAGDVPIQLIRIDKHLIYSYPKGTYGSFSKEIHFFLYKRAYVLYD
jgi:hypothetical protein